MEYSITPSALAYLFGDVLENVFARRASRLTRSETVRCLARPGFELHI